jgi:hypothetical protein
MESASCRGDGCHHHGSLHTRGNQGIRKARTVVAAVLTAQESGLHRRILLQRQHLEGRHEGIQSPPLRPLTHTDVELGN